MKRFMLFLVVLFTLGSLALAGKPTFGDFDPDGGSSECGAVNSPIVGEYDTCESEP